MTNINPNYSFKKKKKKTLIERNFKLPWTQYQRQQLVHKIHTERAC